MGRTWISLILGVAFLVALGYCATEFQVGLGIYDITGPPAEVNMMGMGKSSQRTHGIHFRLRSRAMIVVDKSSSQRLVYVTNNLGMTYNDLMQNITAKLQDKYGDLYKYENLMISGDHTHSGPAGYTYMTLYDVTSAGYHLENFLAIVNGIVAAISMAHDNIADANIYINQGTLLDSNINRSPYSYEFNPPDEIKRYPSNTDTTMTVLRIADANGKDIGLFSWFAVHGTSMNNTNELISGDNKGYASYYIERLKNGNDSLPGMGPFIAGFGQSNEGDVSPNTKGARCPDGSPCDPRTSTCPGPDGSPRVATCIASGPGYDMFESTRLIGQNQANFALTLSSNAREQLKGGIGYSHTFVDAQNITVSASYTSTRKEEVTCPAALGDSFAAGTSDGPGAFNFMQGTNDTSTNRIWNRIAYLILSKPTRAQISCHAPKPILLNLGDLSFPAPWAASVVPIQIFRIGQLVLIGVPGEFTTMAGRRLRQSVTDSLIKYGLADSNTKVVISGLSNEYTHYVTTYEEYQVQRYEAASTLYGPHTLAAYQQEFDRLVSDGLAKNQTSLPGPMPPNLSYVHWCLLECDRGPDGYPEGKPFGTVETDALAQYNLGATVNVTFWGANPDHNFMTQSTYLTVDLQVGSSWKTVLVDGDWDTKFYWKRHETDQSLISITWDIASDTPKGTYRITHQGYYKDAATGDIKPYSGVSRSFTVYGV